MSEEGIKIIIVDDQQLFIDSVELMLNQHPDFQILGTANNGKEMFDLLKQFKPDIILLDIEIPSFLGFDGIELAQKLRESEDYKHVKIISISINTQSNIIRRLLKEIKVDGYIDKRVTSKNELYKALHVVNSGSVYVSEGLEKKALRVLGIELLTDRQREILTLIIDGFSNAQIAPKIFISEKTVDNHRQKIYKKLGCNKINELAKIYYRHVYLHDENIRHLPNFKQILNEHKK